MKSRFVFHWKLEQGVDFFLGFLYSIWPVDKYVIASIRFMICLSNSNGVITKYSSKERREVKVAHQLHNESPYEANHTSSRVPYFRSPCEPSKRCFELWLRFRQFYLKITKPIWIQSIFVQKQVVTDISTEKSKNPRKKNIPLQEA